jgi:hypothetical protein
MKKIIWLLLVLLSCSMAFASIDSIAKCDKKSCVEGSMVHWTVPVFNSINKTIIVEYIRIVDENALSIAYYDAERNKTLEPDESYVYEFDTLIAAPPSGYTWYYKPCMRVKVEGSAESQFVCKDAVKSFSVLPRSKAECFLDSDCSVNEICEGYTLKCTALQCEDGEIVKDHRCSSETMYNKFSGIRNIVLLSIAAVALIAIIALMLLSKKSSSDEEDVSWYDGEAKKEKKAKKNKRNKKKGKKRR